MVAASAVLAVLVIGVFVAMILALSALQTATKQEAQSKEVTTSALNLMTLVLDVETGVRGYVITGKEPFLKPYLDARQQLPRSLNEFEKLASREPRQQSAAHGLTTAIRLYLTEYAENVVLFTDLGAARSSPAETEGKQRIDDIRMRFKHFRATENALAARRERSAEAKSRHAIELGVTGLAGTAALMLLFGFYLASSIARPVRNAAAGASRLASGELSLRLKHGGPGEVGELTRGFNQMAERLESARSELEEQNAQLRESERLKSDLVNTVSHELRTPLAGVLGFTKLLLTRDFDSETRRHYLGIVDAQARRLSELIDDFLDVRRIEEGRFERAQDLLDVGALLQEEAQLYSAQSPKHKLAVTLPEGPLPVMGNPDRLRQVIGNLLSNAIKYSPQGGIVELTAEAHDGAVRVEVRDEGIGIPMLQQPQIFTKFFRGDAAASGIPGTGLGLAVSRDIVESHGGRIGFTSAEGEGATFFIELPSGNGGDGRLQGDSARQS
ncbi:MAG TPA: ATP-binding protein [Gaiellaceae bacterium]|nr:ATP-binding protein [Gaiellaceae bacterium]